MNIFANTFPALTGDVVTEGHARYCADNGHATYKGEAFNTERCPRCGDLVTPDAETIEKFEKIIDAEHAVRGAKVLAGFGIDADTRARGLKDWQKAKSALARLIDNLDLDELAEYGDYRAREARKA